MENSTGGAGAGSGVGKYQEVGSELHLPCLLDIHMSRWRDYSVVKEKVWAKDLKLGIISQ